MRADRRLFAAWTVATAVGLAIGLTTGATLVGFSTGLGDLAVQGAVSGAAVGIAQAVALRSRRADRARLARVPGAGLDHRLDRQHLDRHQCRRTVHRVRRRPVH